MWRSQSSLFVTTIILHARYADPDINQEWGTRASATAIGDDLLVLVLRCLFIARWEESTSQIHSLHWFLPFHLTSELLLWKKRRRGRQWRPSAADLRKRTSSGVPQSVGRQSNTPSSVVKPSSLLVSTAEWNETNSGKRGGKSEEKEEKTKRPIADFVRPPLLSRVRVVSLVQYEPVPSYSSIHRRLNWQWMKDRTWEITTQHNLSFSCFIDRPRPIVQFGYS